MDSFQLTTIKEWCDEHDVHFILEFNGDFMEWSLHMFRYTKDHKKLNWKCRIPEAELNTVFEASRISVLQILSEAEKNLMGE